MSRAVTSSEQLAPSSTSHQHQGGFALIETMVAVFILSLGLLGMANLQLKVMKAARSSETRTQVTILSYYMLDILRVDSASARQGLYNTNDFVCNANTFSGLNLQDDSRKTWLEDMQRNMGASANACAQIKCTNDGLCRVDIRRTDTVNGGQETETFSVTTRL